MFLSVRWCVLILFCSHKTILKNRKSPEAVRTERGTSSTTKPGISLNLKVCSCFKSESNRVLCRKLDDGEEYCMQRQPPENDLYQDYLVKLFSVWTLNTDRFELNFYNALLSFLFLTDSDFSLLPTHITPPPLYFNSALPALPLGYAFDKGCGKK